MHNINLVNVNLIVTIIDIIIYLINIFMYTTTGADPPQPYYY